MKQRWIVVLVLVAALRVAVYSAAIPPWQGPDEPKHYEYVAVLDQLKRPLSPADASPALERQVIESMLQFRFWHYLGRPTPEVPPADYRAIWPESYTLLHRAPFYYVLILPWYHFVKNAPLALQLQVLRLSGMLFFVPTVLLTWLLARRTFPERPDLSFASAIVVAWLPQFTAENSILSNDSLTYLFGVILALVAVGGIRRGWSLKRLTLLLGLLAVDFLVKRTVVLLLPLVLVALILGKWTWRAALRAIVLLVIVVCAGLVAIHVRPGLEARIAGLSLDYPTQLASIVDPSHYSLKALPLYGLFVTWVYESFWAYLGWAARPAPSTVYQLLLPFTALALVGPFVVAARGRLGGRKLDSAQRRILVTLPLGVIGAALGAMLFYSSYFNPQTLPQGRYVFPLMGPAVVSLVAGIGGVWPKRWQRWCAPSVATLVILFDVWYLVGFLIPYFYL